MKIILSADKETKNGWAENKNLTEWGIEYAETQRGIKRHFSKHIACN